MYSHWDKRKQVEFVIDLLISSPSNDRRSFGLRCNRDGLILFEPNGKSGIKRKLKIEIFIFKW